METTENSSGGLGTHLNRGLVSLSMRYEGNPVSSFSTADSTPLRACGLTSSSAFGFGCFLAASVANVRPTTLRTASRKSPTKQLPMAFILRDGRHSLPIDDHGPSSFRRLPYTRARGTLLRRAAAARRST